MRLTHLVYSEFDGLPSEWLLEGTSISPICLVVGRNAAGKSRFLSVINAVARLLRGDITNLFQSGKFEVKFDQAGLLVEYSLKIVDSRVVSETLRKGDEVLLDRGDSGAGEIWAAELGRRMKFEAPQSSVAAQVRRDAVQHPFLQDLHDWASHVRYYRFGSALGKDRVHSAMDFFSAKPAPQKKEKLTDDDAVTQVYAKAYEEFAEPFDQAILRDLATLGYPCSDVGTEFIDPAQLNVSSGAPLVHLFVQEHDLGGHTTQLTMSAGMFRVLAIVIHLNDCIFRKVPATLLIDDIGEGLDFARSQALISLLTDRAKSQGLQLIMTTNDRFVMNGVPLEYWSVISRKGARVKLINKVSSPAVFQEFEQLGLNNFDFFSSDFFVQGMK